MSDTLERIKAQIGMDPEVAIRERKKAAMAYAAIKEQLAGYWAIYRGGTASPYDQKRKSTLAALAQERREEMRAKDVKVKEAELEEYAHAHPDYQEYLEKAKTAFTAMFKLEAELYRADADIAEWDRLLDLSRSMIYWNTSEMKHL